MLAINPGEIENTSLQTNIRIPPAFIGTLPLIFSSLVASHFTHGSPFPAARQEVTQPLDHLD